jgi:uncharacterized membrane protein YjgN (DUF898 family)
MVHSAVPAPSPNRAVMIVLAYLWPLALVPLLVEREDLEVQWHAKHGIVLMVAEIGVLLAFGVLMTLVSLATFGLGCVLSLLIIFIWVAILAIHVAAIIMGLNGKRFVIPRVSEYANRF